jgi:hypothetical protein
MSEREYSPENRSRRNHNARPEANAQPARKGFFGGSRSLDFASADIHGTDSPGFILKLTLHLVK